VSNLPLVSIIMPTFNRADLIGESLDSVLSQSYLNWECIIVDDGSNDTTESVVEAYLKKDKRFRYFYKENGGAASAKNVAIEHSKGVYILPLDSDDLLDASLISKAVKVFEKNQDISLVYSEAKLFGYKNEKWNIPEYDYKLFLVYNMIFNTCMFKKVDFDEVGGYDKGLFEDWDLWMKMLNPKSKVYRIPETLFYYRTQNGESITNRLQSNQKLHNSNLKAFYTKHIDIYMEYIGNPIELEREARGLRKKAQSADFKAAEKLMRNPVFQFFRKVRNYLKRLFNGR
jgi:glycosyltransferase involved in cell wall biosynthesis